VSKLLENTPRCNHYNTLASAFGGTVLENQTAKPAAFHLLGREQKRNTSRRVTRALPVAR
jgi:hypothetical protein